jgi:hypothetical protein
MSEYRLHTLLKIREHKKAVAEKLLQTALMSHQSEQNKLVDIENRLRDTVVARTQQQENFFLRSLRIPSSKTVINCHVLANQKAMIDEITLRKMLSWQREQVRSSSLNVEAAKYRAIDAERNLKVIEKHHLMWQRSLLRAEEIKEQYATDDQNGVRFLLQRSR